VSEKLLAVFRYMPPLTTFAPPNGDGKTEDEKVVPKHESLLLNLVFSQLGCNIIFVIVACITERRRLRNDPLNFSMFNMIFEVIRYVVPSHVINVPPLSC